MLDALPRSSKARRKVARPEISPALVERARRLMQQEIAFIPNLEFAVIASQESAEEAAERAGDSLKPSPRSRETRSALPEGFLQVSTVDLLSPAEERQLFHEMNYLKYRANVLRSAIDPSRPQLATLDLIDRLTQLSRAARDRIVEANLRLVLSIVKQFSQGKHCRDELVSEGLHTLLRAVEKFDFDRGFRLSTYATHAIRRNLYRYLVNRAKERPGNEPEALEYIADPTDERESAAVMEARWEKLRGDLAKLMDRLDPRERAVISARFGLGDQSEPRTLFSLSGDFGVCKERVRQLEQRALIKLRAMADELRIDDPGA